MIGNQIRAKRSNKFTTMNFCPITAIRYAKDKEYYSISNPLVACKNEVEKDLISNVICAADNNLVFTPSETKEQRNLIRKWMLKNLVGDTPTPPK